MTPKLKQPKKLKSMPASLKLRIVKNWDLFNDGVPRALVLGENLPKEVKFNSIRAAASEAARRRGMRVRTCKQDSKTIVVQFLKAKKSKA